MEAITKTDKPTIFRLSTALGWFAGYYEGSMVPKFEADKELATTFATAEDAERNGKALWDGDNIWWMLKEDSE